MLPRATSLKSYIVLAIGNVLRTLYVKETFFVLFSPKLTVASTVFVSSLPRVIVFVSSAAVTVAPWGKSTFAIPSWTWTNLFNSAWVKVSPRTTLIVWRATRLYPTLKKPRLSPSLLSAWLLLPEASDVLAITSYVAGSSSFFKLLITAVFSTPFSTICTLVSPFLTHIFNLLRTVLLEGFVASSLS